MLAILEVMSNICLLIIFLFATVVALATTNERISLGWLLCGAVLCKWFISGSDVLLIPAAMFAVAGAINGYGRSFAEEKHENSENR